MHQVEELTRKLSFVSDASGISEVDCLLPTKGPGSPSKASKHAHRKSLTNTLQTFSIAMQPRKGVVELAEQPSTVSNEEYNEQFFPDVKETREWLQVAAVMLPKVSWGWLPFGFTFLGFGVASKLLLFITISAVYCSALMYRLYEHTDFGSVRIITLSDVGQEALGRFGRRLVDGLTVAINVLLPVVMHVGGMRYLQYFLFVSTGVCLPWISLVFGLGVLALGQIQRFGRHPMLNSMIIPALTASAVCLTIVQLIWLKASQGAAAPAADEASLVYLSDYAMAVICLISANYFAQHTFLEDMSNMARPASFQHSTALAQVLTLLTNAAIGVASFHVPTLKVKGFIAFAFDPSETLPRLLNFLMFLIMTLKYVIILNIQTRRLIPWLPHLMQQVVDPSGVESTVEIRPRELWLIASFTVVAYSYLIANSFPHTFMGLSGLLTSVAYIPMAYTLPCLFSLTLLAHNISALEYALQTWIIPVSFIMSLMGIWASIYHLISKWHQYGESKGCWGCNSL